MRKKILPVLFLLTIILVAAAGCGAYSDEPCELCGSTPSKAYELNDRTAYVCDECSSECSLCGDEATEYYENLFGMVMFACDDCYQELSGE